MFSWRLQKDGYSERTILNYSKFLELLVRYGARLSDPESVKSVISLKTDWSQNTKVTVVAAYSKYATMNRIQWIRPKYKGTSKLPYIPSESEIDSLIAYCDKGNILEMTIVTHTPPI